MYKRQVIFHIGGPALGVAAETQEFSQVAAVIPVKIQGLVHVPRISLVSQGGVQVSGRVGAAVVDVDGICLLYTSRCV